MSSQVLRDVRFSRTDKSYRDASLLFNRSGLSKSSDAYEARYDGFWLHRLLEGHGLGNYVVDPASIQVDRRARRAKADNIDVARILASGLCRFS